MVAGGYWGIWGVWWGIEGGIGVEGKGRNTYFLTKLRVWGLLLGLIDLNMIGILDRMHPPLASVAHIWCDLPPKPTGTFKNKS